MKTTQVEEAENESGSKSRISSFVFKWVFPIHSHELFQVVPCIVMMLSALFVYSTYRDIKDGMVFSEEGQSLMTIQWCKVLVMLVSVPVATIFMKLANVVSRDFIFYQVMIICIHYLFESISDSLIYNLLICSICNLR